MTPSPQNEEPTLLERFRGGLNVCPTSRHIRCNGDRLDLACLGNDFCFTLMIFGVQNLVRNLGLAEQFADCFRDFNGDGTHQHGLSFFMEFLDGTHNRTILGINCFENHIREVCSRHDSVCWNNHHTQVIDFLELVFFCLCCSGHPG